MIFYVTEAFISELLLDLLIKMKWLWLEMLSK